MNKKNTPLLEGLATFEDDRLLITDERALGKINKPHLSPSAAKAVQGCAAKMAANILLPWDDKVDVLAPNKKGDVSHAILEDLMALPAQERTIGFALDRVAKIPHEGFGKWAENEAYLEQLSNPETRAAWEGEITANIENYFQMEDPTKVQVLAREERVEGVPVNGVMFKGFVDRLDLVGENQLRIVDYKTGKVPNRRFGDDHGDQIRTYRAALAASPKWSDYEAVSGKLFYITAGKQVDPSFTEHSQKRTLNSFKKSWELMEEYVADQAFPTLETPLCRWCPIVKACPIAKAAGIEPDPRYDSWYPAEELWAGLEQDAGPSGPTPIDTFQAEETTNAWEEPAGASVETTEPVSRPMPAVEEAQVMGGAIRQAQQNITKDPICPTNIVNEKTPQEEPMTTTTTTTTPTVWREARPYDGAMIDGHVNTASYELTGAFGLASLALEELAGNNMPITPAALGAATRMFEAIVARASAVITGGNTDPGLALNTRLRGALRTVIDTHPVPWGHGEVELRGWANRALEQVLLLAQIAFNIVTYPATPAVEPFEVLGAATPDLTPWDEV